MKFDPDIFKMGYFILYRNDGSLFGNAIEKRQILAGIPPKDAQYTHCEISGGSEYAINISPPISKLIKINEVHKGQYACLVKYKGYSEDGKRYKVAYFSATLCNKGYDIKGILAFLFKWIKQSNRLYFCSEGATWALQMVYPEALNMMADKVMPGHFLNPDEFTWVWEGIINE